MRKKLIILLILVLFIIQVIHGKSSSEENQRKAEVYSETSWEQVLVGGFGEMLDMRISPDNRKLAVTGSSVVHIFDLTTWELDLQLTGHPRVIHSVAWSEDSKMLVTASTDVSIRLWNATTGEEIDILRGHEIAVISACFLGDKIISGDRYGWMGIWNITTREKEIFLAHHGSINSILLSPSKEYIITCSGAYRAESFSPDTLIRVRSVEDFRLIREFSGHTDGVTYAAFSPDGARIASSSRDSTVRLWCAYTGAEIAILEDPEDDVNIVVWSPDGTRLAAGSDDGNLYIWDANTYTLINTIQHPNDVTSLAWLDDSTLISGCDDYTLRVLDLEGNILRTINEHTNRVRAVAWSPDYTRFVSSAEDRTIRIWDVSTGRSRLTIELEDQLESPTYCLDWSPVADRIVSGHTNGYIFIWDPQTGAEINSWNAGFGTAVNSVKYSPDGTRIVSGSGDAPQGVKIWDTEGNLLATCRGHLQSVSSVDWSPDGNYVLSGSEDRTVRIWDATTGQSVRTITAHVDVVTAVSWSPLGDKICSASWRIVKVWTTEGDHLATLGGHAAYVYGLDFLTDGRKVISSSRGEIKLWDIETAELLSDIKGHDRGDELYYYVYSIEWSDENKILSGSADGTVRIWEPTIGISVETYLELRSEEQTKIKIRTTYLGDVLPGVELELNTELGILLETSGITNEDGIFETTFFAPQTLKNLTELFTVKASKEDLREGKLLVPINIYPKVLNCTITLKSELISGEEIRISIYVYDYVGPVENATINITMSNLYIVPSSGLTDENGNFTAILTASRTYEEKLAELTVKVTKEDYQSCEKSLEIFIQPEKRPPGFPIIQAIIIVIIISIVLAIVLYYRSKSI